MPDDEITANLFGDIDYARLSSSVAFVKSGRPITKQIEVGANETLQKEYDIGTNKTSILSVQTAVATGSTNVQLSIHESTQYNKTDQVYRAAEISSGDTDPTGGPVGNGDGIPYVDLTESETLHVQVVENSGVSGAVSLRINHI